MPDIKKQVELILKNYTTMQNEVKVLEFELKRITCNLPSEEIEGAVLSHSNLERVSGSHKSDKTSDIAVEHVDSQRNARYHAIVTLLHNTHSELQRMDYYLSLLPENEATIIKRFYFDNITWTDIMQSTSFAYSTMRLWKKNALDKLVRFYSIAEKSDIEC